jgi:hypothetical protein
MSPVRAGVLIVFISLSFCSGVFAPEIGLLLFSVTVCCGLLTNAPTVPKTAHGLRDYFLGWVFISA